jgi:ribosome maturation factor RimP
MTQIEKIETIITPSLADAGFGIVRLIFNAGRGNSTLQILIEKLNGDPVNVADCISVNRMCSVLLDVEDPISGAYVLEVSSPGVERPLVKLTDFDRFKDRKVKIELKEAFSGRKKFKGLLKGVDGENVLLEGTDLSGEETELFSFPYEDIQRANLVFEMFMEKIGKAK